MKSVAAAEGEITDFTVYRVNRELLPDRRGSGPITGERPSWLDPHPAAGGRGRRSSAAGDQLAITIWDSNENSLSFGPNGQRVVQIESLSVAPDGNESSCPMSATRVWRG